MRCPVTARPAVLYRDDDPKDEQTLGQSPNKAAAGSLRVTCPAPAAYGDRAKQITRIAEEQKLGKRLVRGHPMIEAEVPYACRAEFCEHAEDFIARRTRLAFLDTSATEQALPRVGSLVLNFWTMISELRLIE